MNVSVAMAVYNGEKYLKDQVDSIMCQLDADDEMIISYNESTDNTIKVLADINKEYPSIKIYQWKEKGVISNFENAITHCTKDFIFLSDQDDVWEPNKIEEVMNVFKADPTVLTVVHNCPYVDAELKPLGKDLFKDRNVRKGFFKNLVRNGYQGCCMAFRKDIVPFITPMPRNVAMHDQWIGLLSERAGHIYFLNKPLIKYRKHNGSNSTNHVQIVWKIKWMWNMGRHVFGVLNEKKMLKWYLQSIYAPEKKGKFDYSYGYENDPEHITDTPKEKVVEEKEDNNNETMMYMVDELQDDTNEESDSKE